jgi:hypothetical protein
MRTAEKKEIKEALEEAEKEIGNSMGQYNFFYYLGVALVHAICEVADQVKQVVADMPSHDNK